MISIIIPVYNVELYLKECLESILSQNFNGYEIILVNDGSIDNSKAICEEYKKNYKNILLINKKNGGLSDARNTGIKYAKGDYILFIDSDDYIKKNSLEGIANLVKKSLNKIDVVFLRGYKVFDKNRTIPLDPEYDIQKINNKKKEEVLKYLATLSKFPGSACTKLIRRELILEKKIYFEKGLISEDIDWTLKLLLEAKNFAYYPKEYYYYRQNRKHSITNKINEKTIESLLYIIKKWTNKELEKEYKKIINTFLAYEYLILLHKYSFLEKKLKKIFINEIKDYFWLLDMKKGFLIEFIKQIYKYFGINGVAFFINKIYPINCIKNLILRRRKNCN